LSETSKSKPGKLVVISGPSGAGKTTITSQLVTDPKVHISVSATTRKPREGEIDGRQYHFISRKQFEKQVAEGGFIEHAEVFGNLYGTPRKPVERALREGTICLLEIDVQGALQIMDQYPDATYIFVEPPGFDELSKRLDTRETETPDQKAARLEAAPRETALRERYSHHVVNDDLDQAIKEIRDIIFADK